jgi:hypothetical protein
LIRIVESVESGGGQGAASFQSSERNDFVMIRCVEPHDLGDDQVGVVQPNLSHTAVHGRQTDESLGLLSSEDVYLTKEFIRKRE